MEEKKYYLSKNKYFELYYFCAQYYDYAGDLCALDLEEVKSWMPKPPHPNKIRQDYDQVGEWAARRANAISKINLIEDCLHRSLGEEDNFYLYLFRSVTEELSYEDLDKSMNIHKDMTKEHFNFLRTKFFYFLSKER